jgi:hypothetical protein
MRMLSKVSQVVVVAEVVAAVVEILEINRQRTKAGICRVRMR